MIFLKEVGFSEDVIQELEKNIPAILAKNVAKQKEVVKANISFLQSLGIKNVEEAFMAYSSMFIMNPTKFQEIFNKYDREDLIKKIEKNVAIIEHL